jgi:pimeloyl-ACP methyl ester carboxylesterase
MTDTSPQSKSIDVAGKKTQLTVGGSGPPLLYLHSAGGETEWMPFHEALAQHFTVYLPAHPGFALSEGLDQIDDMYDLVWHYIDLLDLLNLNSVPVVGFSLGAWLGVELAIHRPARVERLVMTAAAGLHLDDAPMAEIFIDDLQQVRELVFYDPASEAVDLAVPTSLDDERILNWIRAREATARIGWNPYLHNPRLAQHLHRVQCPTRVVWGREDKLIPLAHGEHYAEHIPGAQLTVFEQCGHMVPFEKPDEFVGEVAQFVDGG